MGRMVPASASAAETAIIEAGCAWIIAPICSSTEVLVSASAGACPGPALVAAALAAGGSKIAADCRGQRWRTSGKLE